jgi:hypothetical protein
MAEDALRCVKRTTATCTEDNIPRDATRVKIIIDRLLGDKCILRHECKPTPECDPDGAIEECFTLPARGTDFCQEFESSNLPCIKKKLEACKYSEDVTLVQYEMELFIRSYDPSKECGIDVSLMFEDVTTSVSVCFVKMIHGLRHGLETMDTFNKAMCMAQLSYHKCIEDKDVPYLVDLINSQHKEFFGNFWERNCGWMEDMDEEDDDKLEIVPIGIYRFDVLRALRPIVPQKCFNFYFFIKAFYFHCPIIVYYK